VIDIELEEQLIQTNGVRLHTVMAGPKSGPPVILLRGSPEYWRGWVKQLPALVEAGCRVIIPDQCGYNLSDKPHGVKAYNMRELVNDVIGLIDALGYEKVNLVGHDWGATVAWMLAIWRILRLTAGCIHAISWRTLLFSDYDQLKAILNLRYILQETQQAIGAGNHRS